MRNKIEATFFILAILGLSFIGLSKNLTTLGIVLMIPAGVLQTVDYMKEKKYLPF